MIWITLIDEIQLGTGLHHCMEGMLYTTAGTATVGHGLTCSGSEVREDVSVTV